MARFRWGPGTHTDGGAVHRDAESHLGTAPRHGSAEHGEDPLRPDAFGRVLEWPLRGLDFSILDRGFGEQFGTKLNFFPTCRALGLVMPSNSPAVNSPVAAGHRAQTPVIIKPGKEEPWTPYRLIQTFIAAGVPAEAFGFYPTDHDGAATIPNACGRALIFGTSPQRPSMPGIPRSRFMARAGVSS